MSSSSPDPADLRSLVERVPLGWSVVRYAGRRWGLTRSVAADGRAVSLLAEELGGTGLVSANLYLTDHGPQLRPCEMPAETVLAFLRGWTAVPAG